MKMNAKKGFTLIELLVVIAIIALLLSIIMPALRAVKKKAQETICKTNLKQYGYAMTTYLVENDEVFPLAVSSIYKTPTGACQWHNKETSPSNNPDNAGPLWPYLSNMDAHLCPTFESFADRYGSSHPGHNPAIPIDPQYSYSQNAFLGLDIGAKKQSQITRSFGEVGLFVEETIWRINNAEGNPVATHVLNDTIFFSRHPADWAIGDSVGTYHSNTNADMSVVNGTQTTEGGQGNVVFCDGHVELVDPFEYTEGSAGRFYKSYLTIFPKTGAMNSSMPY